MENRNFDLVMPKHPNETKAHTQQRRIESKINIQINSNGSTVKQKQNQLIQTNKQTNRQTEDKELKPFRNIHSGKINVGATGQRFNRIQNSVCACVCFSYLTACIHIDSYGNNAA